MRARGLRGVALILIAGSGFGLAGGSAWAEGTPEEMDAGVPEAREPTPNPAGARARRDRSPPGEREEWWIHARQVLFSDLQLSAEQSRRVEAIIESQVRARKRAEELRAELAVARREGDAQRNASLRAELRASRKGLKGPDAAIEEMRALLSEEQRPTFDMNRARLVAESQPARQGTRAPQPAAGAAVDAE